MYRYRTGSFIKYQDIAKANEQMEIHGKRLIKWIKMPIVQLSKLASRLSVRT